MRVSGVTNGGGNTATEHVGKSAALALVHEDEQDQEDARENEKYLENDFEDIHRLTFLWVGDRLHEVLRLCERNRNGSEV